MKKAILLALLLCAVPVHAQAGTYTFTTTAGDDTAIQTWCFNLNTNTGGTLFAQPANASGITAANAKLCIRAVINSAVAADSLNTGAKALTPTTLNQFN